MGRKNKKPRLRRRPGSARRGPGTNERETRGLPSPEVKPDPGTTIFVTNEKAQEFKDDAALAEDVCSLRDRGLPLSLARLAYDAAQRLLKNPDLNGHEFSKITSGVAALGRVDIETGRFRMGEPAGTINVNQQRTEVLTPEELARNYALAVKEQIEAAYHPPIEKPLNGQMNGKHE